MWEGDERRSAESLLARELVVVKGQASEYEAQLKDVSRWQLARRRKARRSLEIAREREHQILATLGARRKASS